MSTPRVVVGMSGGVDSSVAAALLVKQGYDVVGIAMRLWGGESTSGCCSLDDFLDARRVARDLGIPFYVMDFRDEFQRKVVDPFVTEYLQARTPNPCIRCNQHVKFASFWDRARELGADFVATGHYARVVTDEVSGEPQLWRSIDEVKDQTYFLFAMPRESLAHTLFPVGHLTKAEVREYARRLGLDVAEKSESQEICFAPKGRYAEFVAEHAGVAPAAGRILDDAGRELGRHEGVHQFTVGQRRGIGVSAPDPLYVTRIDAVSGDVTVGGKASTLARGLVARRANWIGEERPQEGCVYGLKIRSRFAAVSVQLSAVSHEGFEVESDEGLPAVTPGQAAVLYDGERVVGGGWIERAVQ